MSLDVVNEKSHYTVTLRFTDENGEAITPVSGSYRIDDVASGQQIRGDTPFVPAGSSHDIVIADNENAIQNAENDTEERVVTVSVVYGADSRVQKSEYRYYVRNLLKVS